MKTAVREEDGPVSGGKPGIIRTSGQACEQIVRERKPTSQGSSLWVNSLVSVKGGWQVIRKCNTATCNKHY